MIGTAKRDRARHQARKHHGRGKIESPCQDCGGSAVDLHHEDYERPLDVVPLCEGCHFKRHGKKFTPRNTEADRARAWSIARSLRG